MKYKAMTYHPDSLPIAHFNDEVLVVKNKECCRGLTYRYLLIKHNLLTMTNRFKYTNPNEVRFMCEYEMETYPDPMVDECPGRALAILRALNRPYTQQALAAVTTNEIRHVYRNVMKPMMKDSSVVSRMCSHCGQFEEQIKFKACSRCHSEFYCSTECQKKVIRKQYLPSLIYPLITHHCMHNLCRDGRNTRLCVMTLRKTRKRRMKTL